MIYHCFLHLIDRLVYTYIFIFNEYIMINSPRQKYYCNSVYWRNFTEYNYSTYGTIATCFARRKSKRMSLLTYKCILPAMSRQITLHVQHIRVQLVWLRSNCLISLYTNVMCPMNIVTEGGSLSPFSQQHATSVSTTMQKNTSIPHM